MPLAKYIFTKDPVNADWFKEKLGQEWTVLLQEKDLEQIPPGSTVVGQIPWHQIEELNKRQCATIVIFVDRSAPRRKGKVLPLTELEKSGTLITFKRIYFQGDDPLLPAIEPWYPNESK